MPQAALHTGTTSLWSGLKAVYAHISPRRRRQFYLVQLLMIAGALAELATIGAVIPFLTLLASNEAPSRSSVMLAKVLPVGTDPTLGAAAIFMLFAIVAGIIRVQLTWSSRSFVFGCGHEIAVEIQRRVLLQPYSFHIHRNSSSLLAALDKTEVVVMEVLLPMMQASTSGVMALFVISVLLAINPIASCSAAAAFAIVYAAASIVTRTRLRSNSTDVNLAYDERMQIVQESLGGIRDVIVDSSQPLYLRFFCAVDARLVRARVTNQFIAAAPRYLAETVGMIVIAGIALVAASRSGVAAALPLLGALALGGQRLLPLIQQIYGGWASVASHRSIFAQTIDLLRLPVHESESASAAPLELRDAIRLEDVSLSYPTRGAPALDRVTLTVPRGAMIALVGPTGSGKSTLADVIMGLLPSDKGRVLIDKVPLTEATQARWHRSIAHVPQSIFLADTTIARNITISLPEREPDAERIIAAATKAQLHDFILSLPAGYETYVGERGIRLSGGQRQRLGIARAIYKGTPILVLDEATSALDDRTEEAVLAALDELRRAGRTVIIIAHRQSTIRRCDAVVQLDSGRIVRCTGLDEVPHRGRRS
jgi:ABC-type multidrug transport system fused ATPase/permease subunit